MKKILVLVAVLLLGCDEFDEFVQDVLHDDNTVPVASPTPLETPEPTPTPVPVNPDCDGVQSFSGGTLWKPKSESDGNLVFLIRNEFVEPFSCSVVTKKGGSIESLTFKGFSNGDRQTHRGSKPGGKYENDGTVTCVDSEQTCLFQFSGKSGQRKE